MSSSVSRDTDASHSRGRKRSHAEEEKSETSSKRSKLTTDSTVHSQNGRRDKDDEGPRRALTPEELAHEKDIKERSKKYQRTVANKTKVSKIKDKRLKHIITKQEAKFRQAAEQAARAEILHTETGGTMEAESALEATWKVKQADIVKEADMITASKMFRLNLPTYGTCSFEYSRNGRYLLIAGERGHVVVVDWQKNKLIRELDALNENVRHACFLHNETMFAVAQKQNVYIYDKSGTELHRLRNHRNPLRVIYLPYHFLLVSIGREGILRYQDTSTGELIAELKTKLGQCATISYNPRNAIVCLGHNNGSVSMWAPLNVEPLVKMLCHRGAVTSIVIDTMGTIMITSGEDGCLKVWSLKTYQLLQTYYVKRPISQLALSQTGLLGIAFGAHVQIWKDFVHEEAKEPYMLYQLPDGGSIRTIQFCPFEDILGIGHDLGFISILVPGAGEAHIDTFEANPYETKKQRREATVQRLLDKIQPSMIVLDPDTIGSLSNTSKKDYQKNVDSALMAQKAQQEADEGVNIVGPRSGPKVKRGPVVDKKRQEMQDNKKVRLEEEIQRKKQREAEYEAMDANQDESFVSRSALDRFKSR